MLEIIRNDYHSHKGRYWKAEMRCDMTKTVNGIEYRDGYPQEQGWYHCLLDGEKINLRNYWCCVGNRHEWIRADGSYEYGDVWYADKYD